ncbi:ABC transporter substrate-binding protein [Ewingella americana]|uniref:ABC transporter substrate-binding protein n=1 Tax=Ewingella americana TaxID=41202 RepID=UPI001639F45B|nr:ABC transporter substrate-binding protein [Ewingella americana]QMV52188.1 ABC transporter substrate-binding protein [Ewingella americana]
MFTGLLRPARLLAVASSLLISFVAQAAPFTVTDIAGRQVTFDHTPQRVMLADSRALIALNILHPEDPLKNIVSMDNSLQTKAADMNQAYLKKFPKMKDIPIFDNPYVADFSVEKAVTLKPDLVIFDTGLLSKMTDSGTLALLQKLNIPVLFIDFRQQPLTNTVASMQMLGKVFDEEKNAQTFIDFYQQRLNLIRQRVATLKPEQRPSVFIERHAGLHSEQCCSTFGKGSFGQFIDEAGGQNIGSKLFPAMGGDINVEQLISSNPDYYLMTGADWSRGNKPSGAVPFGYSTNEAAVQKSLNALMNRNGISVLKSIKDKQVLAMYHQFYDLPFNVIAVEEIAKFLHPDLFKDIDPLADLKMAHEKFTSLDYSGVFWATPQ